MSEGRGELKYIICLRKACAHSHVLTLRPPRTERYTNSMYDFI